jgi:hypothetical protein
LLARYIILITTELGASLINLRTYRCDWFKPVHGHCTHLIWSMTCECFSWWDQLLARTLCCLGADSDASHTRSSTHQLLLVFPCSKQHNSERKVYTI